MFDIVLYQPEIAPNTGNIIRLAANTGARLHLVRPLGFTLNDRTLARAGLDYHDRAQLILHDDWAACQAVLGKRGCGARLYAFSTRGVTRHDRAAFAENDVLLFGPETRGLPAELLESLPPDQRLRLPMCAGNRSLNLANAVAVVVYEAWRQLDFRGGD